MGRLVFAIYMPNKNQEQVLLEIVKKHSLILKEENLISDRKAIVLKAKSGQIIEIFEWKSEEAIGFAHKNQEVLKIWGEFAKICTHQSLYNLAELNTVFPDFEIIEL